MRDYTKIDYDSIPKEEEPSSDEMEELINEAIKIQAENDAIIANEPSDRDSSSDSSSSSEPLPDCEKKTHYEGRFPVDDCHKAELLITPPTSAGFITDYINSRVHFKTAPTWNVLDSKERSCCLISLQMRKEFFEKCRKSRFEYACLLERLEKNDNHVTNDKEILKNLKLLCNIQECVVTSNNLIKRVKQLEY